MRAFLPLLCVTLWLPGASGVPVKKQKDARKLANLDDVSVLMYGVLQFSDAIHHVYQDTGHGMTRINALLQRQQEALRQLKEEAALAAQAEGEIRKTLSYLKMRTAGLYGKTLQVRTVLQEAEKEQAELQSQVTSLETSLDSASNIKVLKDQALQHSKLLKVLEKWVQDEKRTLEDQDQQLTHIQKQARSQALFHQAKKTLPSQ